MNMQKIELGHTVLHEKTNQLGTVVDINKKRTEASILIQDFDDKGEVLSEITITKPLAELKIVKEIEELGEAIQKAVNQSVKDMADTTKKSSKNISNNMKQFTKSSEQKKEEALTLKMFRKNIYDIIENMLRSLSLKDSDNNFLSLQQGFIQKINEAIEKEKAVELRTDDLDIIIAQVDALTDTNYFLNGSLVEIGVTPNTELLEELSTERYPLKNRLYHQVAEFHTVGGHPVANSPTLMSKKRMLDRFGYTVEELVEFIRATSTSEKEFEEEMDFMLGKVRQLTRDIRSEKTQKNTIENQAELLKDMLNSLNNMFATINMPQGVFGDIVHNANMTKFYKNEKGEYYAKIRESDGKIMKSPDFVAPEPLIEKEVKKILGVK